MSETAVQKKDRKTAPVFKALKIAGGIVLALLLSAVLLLAVPLVTGAFFDGEAPGTRSRDNPYIVLGSTLVSAHRSGGDIAPENTLAAFKNCIESPDFNVDLFEFDLHITKDGRLILLHDATLDRTTDAPEFFGEKDIKPCDKTYDELMKLNFGENFKDENGEYPYRGLRGNSIPTDLHAASLEDVLDYLESKGNFKYIIEIKDSGENGFRALDKLYATVTQRGITEKVILGTFHGEVTRYADEVYPDMLRSASIKEVIRFYFACGFGIDLKDESIKYDALQIPANQYKIIRLGCKRMINYAHRHNIAVQYWTINDAEDVRALSEIGADCIMSDNPAMAYSVINHNKTLA